MRRVVNLVVLGLGVFSIAAGLLLRFYAYPALAKIPHNIDSLSVAEGSGITALVYVEKPGSPTLPEIRHNLKLRSTTKVTGDMRAPEVQADSDVTSWIEASKVVVTDEDITMSASVRELCLDRFTGEAVAPCTNQYVQKTVDKDKKDTKVLGPQDKPQFPGLNFKFPFDTGKTTYQWYDSSVNKSVDAKFDGEDKINGVDVYRFRQVVAPTSIDKRAVPGSLVGQPETATVNADLYYQVDRTLWIEPATGAVINLRQSGKQELRASGQLAGSGTVVFDGTLELNEESVAKNVKTAQDNMSRLWLLTGLPLILWIVGGVLTVAGIVLVIMRRRTS